MAERVDGPGDPVLKLRAPRPRGARDRRRRRDRGRGGAGRSSSGSPEALTALELDWIERGGQGGESGRTSMGLTSLHAFAWRPLAGDPTHALGGRSWHRRALTGDLGRPAADDVRTALGGSSQRCSGSRTAHFLARDVSETTHRLRELADRIASGRPDPGGADRVGGRARRPFAHAFERDVRLASRDGRPRRRGCRRRRGGRRTDGPAVGTAVTTAPTDQARAVERAARIGGARSTARSAASRTSAQMLSAHVEEAGSSVLELGAAGEELKQTRDGVSGKVDGVTRSIEQMVRSVQAGRWRTPRRSADAATETSRRWARWPPRCGRWMPQADETARLSDQVVSSAERGRERRWRRRSRGWRRSGEATHDGRAGDPRSSGRRDEGDRRDRRRDRRRGRRDEPAGAQCCDHRGAGRGAGQSVFGGGRRDQGAGGPRAGEHERNRRADPCRPGGGQQRDRRDREGGGQRSLGGGPFGGGGVEPGGDHARQRGRAGTRIAGIVSGGAGAGRGRPVMSWS